MGKQVSSKLYPSFQYPLYLDIVHMWKSIIYQKDSSRKKYAITNFVQLASWEKICLMYYSGPGLGGLTSDWPPKGWRSEPNDAIDLIRKWRWGLLVLQYKTRNLVPVTFLFWWLGSRRQMLVWKENEERTKDMKKVGPNESKVDYSACCVSHLFQTASTPSETERKKIKQQRS